jgi:site-specific DNA recombinase
LRAAVYLRVSTGRQAEGEVSIPSQRDLTTRHCLSNGWTVVDEYVEPGASATDDRRPVFQAMLERAAIQIVLMTSSSCTPFRGFSATGPQWN